MHFKIVSAYYWFTFALLLPCFWFTSDLDNIMLTLYRQVKKIWDGVIWNIGYAKMAPE